MKRLLAESESEKQWLSNLCACSHVDVGMSYLVRHASISMETWNWHVRAVVLGINSCLVIVSITHTPINSSDGSPQTARLADFRLGLLSSRLSWELTMTFEGYCGNGAAIVNHVSLSHCALQALLQLRRSLIPRLTYSLEKAPDISLDSAIKPNHYNL